MTAAWSLPSGLTVLERGWLSSNNILVRGRDQCALVDSGYASHAGQTCQLVAAALQGRPLDLLICTHLHSDHCGGNASLQSLYPGVRTLVPPGLAQAVERWDPVELTYEPTGQRCDRFRLGGVLQPGSEITLGDLRWQVHAAPGHDPHSVILFEPDSRTLISADAFWQNGFGIVFPELEGESAFDEVGATLDLIERLAPLVVIPGHGPVFGGSEAVALAMTRARTRLASFVNDPARHAAHAAKVLLKFRMLEAQRQPWQEFLDWAVAMPYLGATHARYFSAVDRARWTVGLVDDLCRSGALVRAGDTLLDA